MKVSRHCYAVTGLAFLPPWSVNAGLIAGQAKTLVVDTGANMQAAPVHERDPLRWCALGAAAFLALLLIRLAIPSKPYFDEIHYLPAARAFLDNNADVATFSPIGRLVYGTLAVTF